MLLALILVVVAWISYVYIIEPQMKKINDLDLELRLSQTELQKLNDLIKIEPEMDKAIENNYAQIQEVATKYFNKIRIYFCNGILNHSLNHQDRLLHLEYHHSKL